MEQDFRVVADKAVGECLDRLWALALDIHAHPEVAFHEVRTSRLCADELAAHGFVVERPWDDLPTAFVARLSTGGQGEGPCVGLVSELDAMPEGHVCGHNLIATSGVLAGIATAQAMRECGIRGEVRVYGTPAEEDGGGKIIMLDRGAFAGVDAMLMMHPTSATTRIGGECCSAASVFVTFAGRPAQAESHPDEGVNAMDAATLFHAALGMARQQLPDGIHIACVVRRMSDDVVNIPALAELELEVTTMSAAHLLRGVATIRRIAEGVAHATACELDIREEPGYLGRTPNATIGDVLRNELLAVGEPCMEGMPADKGSEDFGNVSRVVPGVNMFGTILPERKISGHTQLFCDLAASESGRHCLEVSSRAMARTALCLMADPSLVDAAKEELAGRLAEE